MARNFRIGSYRWIILKVKKSIRAVKAEEMFKDFKALRAVEVVEICYEEEENAEKLPEIKDEKGEKVRNEGRVLFVLNLKYATEEEDLLDRFKIFGLLNYASVVCDRETGKSKGTAFICFKKPEVVDQVLQILEESGIELD